MSTLEEIKSVLTALQIKQSKYKYDFITKLVFNQKIKQVFNRYEVIKYHTEVIESTRYKIQDSAKRGTLNNCLLYLVDELKGVDST